MDRRVALEIGRNAATEGRDIEAPERVAFEGELAPVGRKPQLPAGCQVYRNAWAWDQAASWKNPGHEQSDGCLRCHKRSMRTEDREQVSNDCETCHVVLAEAEENPDILSVLNPE